MSINDPILEMLSFQLENDLSIMPPQPAQFGSSPSTSADFGVELGRKGTGAGGAVEEISFVKSSSLFGEEDELLCLLPSCQFKISGNLEGGGCGASLLTHLLSEHRLVIEKVDEIANWTKYLSYWRDKLGHGAEMKDFCIGFLMEGGKEGGAGVPDAKTEPESKVQSNDGGKSEDEMYFMLTPALPEDSQLRKKLWKERLDVVLEVNRQEREETGFSRRCLFCRDVVGDNRSKYFIHMREKHSFHIGQPDNLVFVKELLHLIEEKLNRLECLFCRHIFKDKVILKEHMRKKQHRQLNPKNSEYDRFYVVNYLEPGKTWETIHLEGVEDEDKEDEWVEPLDEKERNVVCLFCKTANSDFPAVLDHMKSEHGFDFVKFSETLDFYQKIKTVNFIRRNVYQNSCFCCEERFQEADILLEHIQKHRMEDFQEIVLRSELWNQPEYFFPTYENDDFLTFLDGDDNTTESGVTSSDDESNVFPEDLPHIDKDNRDFDLAGFAIRYHNQSN